MYGLILLNEILARPVSATTYIAALQEIETLCGQQADELCSMLGSALPWQEMKRYIVGRALRIRGEFALFDVISDVVEESR